MASIWRLQRFLPSGDAALPLRQMLTVPALVARAPRIARIVLGVAIAAQAVAIALSLWGDISAGSAADVAANARVRDKQRLALDGITAAHLFGVAPQETKVAAVTAVSSPLVLTGTLATGDPRNGFAILGSSADRTRTIYVGSEAAPGTVLIKVYPRWVVLKRGDERLTLRFPRDNRMRGGAAGANRMLLAEESPAPEPTDGTGAFALPTPLPRPQITNDAAVVRSFGGLVPATTVDGEQGMQIMGTAFNSKALRAMGLRSGDVIVQVNGVAVDAPNAPDLVRALQSGNVTLTVDRRGEDTSVTLDSSSIADAATAYRQADPDL